MEYNCLMKNLHIGLEYEEEPKPPKQEDNGNSFDYGVYDPVDLDNEEVDGQIVSMVRCILAVSKVLFFKCWFNVRIKLKNPLLIVGAT